MNWKKEKELNVQKAFDQLNGQNQMAAIDAAVATILLGIRIPSTGKPLYDWMATEFASCYSLSPNVVKYALRDLGEELYAQDWTLTIEKRGAGLSTKFSHPDTNNGEGTIIVE